MDDTSTDSTMHNFTLLIGRLGLALVFILSGGAKLAAYPATTKLLVNYGLAPGLLPLVILAELGGGLAIACGFLTRWAAVGLCIYSVLVAIVLQGSLADHGPWMAFMKNLAIAGGFLVLAAQGPGDLSIDAWRRRRKQRQKLFF